MKDRKFAQKGSRGGAKPFNRTGKSSGRPAWRERDSLSWPVGLTAGTDILGIVFANPFHDEDTEDQGQVYLDRLRVTDAGGGLLLK